jgi:hypothetical protein
MMQKNILHLVSTKIWATGTLFFGKLILTVFSSSVFSSSVSLFRSAGRKKLSLTKLLIEEWLVTKAHDHSSIFSHFLKKPFMIIAHLFFNTDVM